MSFKTKLEKAIKKNNSLLCVGLDVDKDRLPKNIQADEDFIFKFNKAIIDATKDFVCAYKPNLAFYEYFGEFGINSLKRTIEYIPDDIVVIADAKRGDIGNTCKKYAGAIFDDLKSDAVTLNPYMGFDSVEPFMEYEEKGFFILCLTSNKSSADFQLLEFENKKLYEIVAQKVTEWDKGQNCGLVVGATHPEQIKGLREIAPDLPVLIPGIGAQGGDIQKTKAYATNNNQAPAIIVSARKILYASTGNDFAEQAGKVAEQTMKEINKCR